MNPRKAKLIAAIIMMCVVLAMVGAGTYAWYTLSQKGEASMSISIRSGDTIWPFEIIQQPDDMSEIKTTEDILDLKGWAKSVKLRKIRDAEGNEHDIGDSYQLRPVSTLDGTNWYIATYDDMGNVVGLELEDLDSIANIDRHSIILDPDKDEVPVNYLYYYDIWIKTEIEDMDHILHLSNPFDMSQVTEDEIEDGFGTYVLPKFIPLDDANREKKLQQAYDMSTCMRLGFLIYDQDSSGEIEKEQPGTFWIYEPNCDARAKGFKKFEGNKTGKNSAYEAQKNIDYIYDPSGNIKVEEHEDTAKYRDGEAFDTLLPYLNKTKGITDYKYSDHTIVQTSSEMNPDTGEITKLGKFKPISGEETPGLEGIDTPGFVKVSKDKPQHIRVFIWIEGQDIDCWDSTMSGNIDIHLEFRSEDVAIQE